MKKCSKYLLALMGVVFLSFSGKTTAQAQEVPAPFTAQQLLDTVNAQEQSIGSVRQVLTEGVTMVDTTSGVDVSVNMTVDMQQNRTAGHVSYAMTMSSAAIGYSQSMSYESYVVTNGTVRSTYTSDEKSGQWSVTHRALTAQELADTSFFEISEIDTATATVMLDGNVVRLYGTVDAESMEELTELMSASGMSAAGAFPVILEVDAATMLPKSMVIGMNGITMDGMQGMTTAATAVVTYDGYNQYNVLTVPAAVAANAR